MSVADDRGADGLGTQGAPGRALGAAVAEESWRRFRETGDVAALGTFFDATAPILFRLALAAAPDAATAEDAVQSTYLVLLARAGRHDSARPVIPWVIGVLRNECAMARRGSRRGPSPERVRKPESVADPALGA